MQAMCQVYAAVSYICIGDAESSSQVQSFTFWRFLSNSNFHFEKDVDLTFLEDVFLCDMKPTFDYWLVFFRFVDLSA